MKEDMYSSLVTLLDSQASTEEKVVSILQRFINPLKRDLEMLCSISNANIEIGRNLLDAINTCEMCIITHQESLASDPSVTDVLVKQRAIERLAQVITLLAKLTVQPLEPSDLYEMQSDLPITILTTHPN